MDMTNLHRSPPMNQSKTDLEIADESQLMRFGIRRAITLSRMLPSSALPATSIFLRALANA
ncbi:MAG: hypothetical protein ABIL01_05105 [Pseudomonadota bacterium]